MNLYCITVNNAHNNNYAFAHLKFLHKPGYPKILYQKNIHNMYNTVTWCKGSQGYQRKQEDKMSTVVPGGTWKIPQVSCNVMLEKHFHTNFRSLLASCIVWKSSVVLLLVYICETHLAFSTEFFCYTVHHKSLFYKSDFVSLTFPSTLRSSNSTGMVVRRLITKPMQRDTENCSDNNQYLAVWLSAFHDHEYTLNFTHLHRITKLKSTNII